MSVSDLIVHDWSTECGVCGYGKGGWAASPALEGKPILTPESTECPSCEAEFTDIVYDTRIAVEDG